MSPILGSLAAIAARAYRAASAAFSSFSDNFNRTTSGSLGTSSSGGLWSALKGVWYANGNAAKTDDAASTYPIANIEMTSADVTASISTGSLVTISTTGTVGSISSNTVGGATFYTATITNMSSTTGMAAGQRIAATNGTGSLFGGTPDFVEITSVVSGTSITYRTKNGTTPTAGTVTNIQSANNDGGSGISLWITDSGNWWGVSYGRSIDNSCNCSTCNTCTTYQNYQGYVCNTYAYAPGYNCLGYTNYTSYGCIGYTSSPVYSCGAYGFSVSYSCNGWSTNFGYQCTDYDLSIFYTCNGYAAGGYLCLLYQSSAWGQQCVEYDRTFTCYSFSTTYVYTCVSSQPVWTTYCSGGYTATYSTVCNSYSVSYTPTCNQWNSYTGPSCSSFQLFYTTVCNAYSTVWSPSCTVYGFTTCNCQTCYPPYIRFFKSVSNVVSEVTRWSLSAMAAAFRVITNSSTKTVTIRPYREVSMTTQIGSDLTSTQATATMETKFGIVLGPSDYVQGSTLDDFNINSN